MESIKSTDFKLNVADLTKIPPNEFEKGFQDWMERDDVARSLQAKLRCDLIKNFNKTNLGKHILSHTMTSSGGSTMRLTLSPLVLALNTLVAEFLYAQNCHFTLSVFCTEIPFRNTLPDFESMRRFRFNKEEIAEIWQAVTGSKGNKKDLNKHIIQNYETNPNISLLLLIIKYLLEKEPLEHFKRNAEVQTEFLEKLHKSTTAQVSDQERKSESKLNVRDDSNLYHINKYLLTLSEKVVEMTREFEQFAKQRRESRTRILKSSRSREYYTLNKSLERITENMKAMAQAKRKNKRLSNIVESIENLTQQFGKCAQNFDNVIKFVGGKENTSDVEMPRRAKVKLKEKQTETEFQEKSYNDWIKEMRYTENGQKFLNRVEISLRKALTKHREELKTETDIKVKHLKGLMRLHYQQKLSRHLLQDPKISLEEARTCNDNIEKKLQQFESKQMELLQKLQESSLELKEAQLLQKQSALEKEEEKINEREDTQSHKSAPRQSHETHFNPEFKSSELQRPEKLDGVNTDFPADDAATQEKTLRTSLRDVSKVQEQILGIAQNIAEQGRSADQIIYDAKLRIQQLENESHQLEQNFQSYLERRKRSQEEGVNNQNMPKIHTYLQDLHQITSARFRPDYRKSATFNKEEDQLDEEIQRLKEKLMQTPDHVSDGQKTGKSSSSTSSLEIKNAILEAKLNFFQHENTIRKCTEQEKEIRTGNLLQKQLEKYPELPELQDYISESNVNAETKLKPEFNGDSSLSEINIKDKTLDDEQIIALSPAEEPNSEKKTPTSIRRELFPNYSIQKVPSKPDLQAYLIYHEPISLSIKSLKQNLIEQKPMKKTDTTSELIKQSMAKMQQLFEQQSKSQETLREMVNELQQEKTLQKEDTQTTIKSLFPTNEALNKSFATVMTSTTDTTETSKETEKYPKGRLLLNISSESENSLEMTTDVLKETYKAQVMTKESKELDLNLTNLTQEVGQTTESSESGELRVHLSPAPIEKQQEFCLLDDSSQLSDFSLHSPDNGKEIGEHLTQTNHSFVPIDEKLGGESFSSRSTSDLEMSTGQINKDATNLGDDSESDFWA